MFAFAAGFGPERHAAPVKVLVATVLAGLLAGCGGTPASPNPTEAAPRSSPSPQALARVIPALCKATRAASRSALEARAIFEDHAHQDLHELAAHAQTRDWAAAGRLLEAKNLVEQDIQFPARWERLAGDLAALTVATRAALAALSVHAPACPD